MNKIFKTFSVLFFITILLKVFDVVKNLIIVSKLGVSDNADIYLSLISLPEGIIILLGFDTVRGVANSEYSSMDASTSKEQLKESFQNMFKILLVIAPILLLIVLLLRKDIIHYLLPGFSGEKLYLSYNLSIFILPILLFKIFSGFLVSVNNAMKRFYLPAIFSSVITFCIIASIYLDYFNNELIYNLSIATLIGNIIYTIILLIGSKSLFNNFSYRFLKIDPLTKKLLNACFAIIILVICNQLYLFSRNYFVSYFPDGAISSINYAGTLPGFYNMLVFSTIFSATLSHLSTLFYKHENNTAKDLFWNTLNRIVFVSVPIILILIAADTEIISILYLRGSFLESDVGKVAIPFVWESISILTVVLSLISTALFLAKKKYLELTIVGSVIYILGIIMNFLLSSTLGFYGVSISGLITTGLFSSILLLRANKFWISQRYYVFILFKLLVSGVITFILSYIILLIFENDIQNLNISILLSIKVTIIVLLYVILTTILNVNYITELKLLFNRKKIIL